MLVELDHDIARDNPELVVSTLLQHALQATRHAFVSMYPEIGAQHDLGQVDHGCHLGLLIAHEMRVLDELLTRYRRLTEAGWHAAQNEQLPF